MRRLLGAGIVMLLISSVLPAADPTKEDAFKLLDKLKVRYKADKNNNLARLDLNRKKLTNDDLKTIATLSALVDLQIEGAIVKEKAGKIVYAKDQIDNDGLKNLAGLTALRSLTLSGTNVDDAGLVHLAGMKNLTTLVLSNTKVTDEGMEALTKLPKLQSVSLFNTKVTESGVGKIKRWKFEVKVNK